MNQQEFEDTAAHYRDELLRMYRAQNIQPQPKPDVTMPPPATVPVIAQPTPPPETLSVPQSMESLPPTEDRPSSRYQGTISVHVTTARGARPVAAATVIITQSAPDGTERLISMQISGRNGEVPRVSVPAPPPSDNQRRPAFFAYDITVSAAGYYRENSRDVPVFPNIVSLQNFDLIPLPAGTDDALTAGDVTFYNSLPQS